MTNDAIDLDEVEADSPGTPMTSPFCGSLRSKKFFKLDAIATKADDYIDASNHCWCRETQQVIGLDGGRVSPESCVPGRSCYKSALDES